MAKKKLIIKSCGNCHICNKEHMSNEGGWIINAEKLNFCHSIEHSCFDIYLTNIHTPNKKTHVNNISLDKRMEMYNNYLKTRKYKDQNIHEKK